ncbi:MAG: uroporphyrinogen decarboxylase family protein, partial [Aristaeellaceae bacterium]
AGTPESMRAAVRSLLDACGHRKNFIISSGCDIPPRARWENINAFFDEVARYGGNAYFTAADGSDAGLCRRPAGGEDAFQPGLPQPVRGQCLRHARMMFHVPAGCG